MQVYKDPANGQVVLVSQGQIVAVLVGTIVLMIILYGASIAYVVIAPWLGLGSTPEIGFTLPAFLFALIVLGVLILARAMVPASRKVT